MDLSPSGYSLALLMVVPVVAAALRLGRRGAWATAVLATAALSLALPPVGRFSLNVTDDIVAVIVFTIVALAVGTLVSSRVELLARVEAQREAVLRSVSHDLRTPLAAIRAAATELSSDAVHEDEARATLLGVVEQEAEHLDRLVANLLAMSRSRAGALVAERRPVDLEELLEVSAVRARRFRPGIDVTVDAAGLPEVLGDYGLLEQLVVNLLENAVRHSPPAGTVEVTARWEGARVVLVVADRGPGIPEAERDAVFEPFRTGDNRGSSGLGLAICRAVAEAHAGTIAARERIGGGAELVVELPGG